RTCRTRIGRSRSGPWRRGSRLERRPGRRFRGRRCRWRGRCHCACACAGRRQVRIIRKLCRDGRLAVLTPGSLEDVRARGDILDSGDEFRARLVFYSPAIYQREGPLEAVRHAGGSVNPRAVRTWAKHGIYTPKIVAALCMSCSLTKYREHGFSSVHLSMSYLNVLKDTRKPLTKLAALARGGNAAPKTTRLVSLIIAVAVGTQSCGNREESL